MKYTISKEKMNTVMVKFLNEEFEGFSDIDYSWADFNCGMGVCCDMYAVGFVLPSAHYDDYLFKLIDSENYSYDGRYKNYPDELPEPCYEVPNINDPAFDTILISEELYEGMENYFSFFEDWKSMLLSVINDMFNIDKKHIKYEFE